MVNDVINVFCIILNNVLVVNVIRVVLGKESVVISMYIEKNIIVICNGFCFSVWV